MLSDGLSDIDSENVVIFAHVALVSAGYAKKNFANPEHSMFFFR
jgi:hypothetical protein